MFIVSGQGIVRKEPQSLQQEQTKYTDKQKQQRGKTKQKQNKHY